MARRPPTVAPDPLLGDARHVADLLDISERTVRRYSQTGVLPRPIVLGRLRRWRLTDIRKLVSDGGI